ncbi:UNKNOWN [Stylonychia lemnae]|uniref:Uncharacterized protein n=1 Tax=Stylonychia lemnae TaxID=5949 RepID=A0A078AQC1_STYLE|nr:UNKNOWN [Stylonychia lemnae]|eukprot:CDW83442.1 UNKNOWN [Stylonychia lemnae]
MITLNSAFNLYNKQLLTKLTNKLQNYYNVAIIHSNVDPNCDSDMNCPYFIRFVENKQLKKLTLDISDTRMKVSIQDQGIQLTKDFEQIFFRVLEQGGKIIGHYDSQSRKTISNVKLIHITHHLMLDNKLNLGKYDSQILQKIIENHAEELLVRIYGDLFPQPDFVFTSRPFSIQQFSKAVIQNEDQYTIKSEQILEHFSKNQEYHQIPQYSIHKSDKNKYLKIHLFDSQLLNMDLKLSKDKSAGEQFEYVLSITDDYSLAVVNTSSENKDQVTQKIRTILINAIQKALTIDTFNDLINLAKKKKIQLNFQDNSQLITRDYQLQVFQRNQIVFDKVQDIKDFISIIEVLKLNELEKNKLIFNNQSVFELVNEIYKSLSKEQGDNLTMNDEYIKNALGVLYQTKEINPPYYFSLSFSIGVYLPLLSPLIFPPLLTLFQYIKAKYIGKNVQKKIKNE